MGLNIQKVKSFLKALPLLLLFYGFWLGVDGRNDESWLVIAISLPLSFPFLWGYFSNYRSGKRLFIFGLLLPVFYVALHAVFIFHILFIIAGAVFTFRMFRAFIRDQPRTFPAMNRDRLRSSQVSSGEAFKKPGPIYGAPDFISVRNPCGFRRDMDREVYRDLFW